MIEVDSADRVAATEIKRLLAGQPPNGVQPADRGPWEEYVRQLREAYGQGSTPAVLRAFDAFWHDGIPLDRGFGRQVALLLDAWQVTRAGDQEAIQLSLLAA